MFAEVGSCRSCTRLPRASRQDAEIPAEPLFVLALASAVAVWLLIYGRAWAMRSERWREPHRRALCRHLARAHHHSRHGDFRRARRHDGGERNTRCAASVLLAFTAGYGFVGIAVALMGRGHPVGMRVRRPALRRALSGGTESPSQANHLARHDRGHPGAGDPLCRRAGIHAEAVDREVLARKELRDGKLHARLGILDSGTRLAVPLLCACCWVYSEKAGVVDIGLGASACAAFASATTALAIGRVDGPPP